LQAEAGTRAAAIPIRVLILEDSPSDAELMVEALRRAGFDPGWERVATQAEFVSRLEPEPDLILSDYGLPGFTGLEAVRLARARGLDVAFILVSGSIGEGIAVEVMREGADDYLLKDRMARLGQAAIQAIEKKKLRDEMRRAERAMQESEERFRAAFEQAGVGMALRGMEPRQSRWLRVNQKLCDILGYTRDELLQLTSVDITPPEDRDLAIEYNEKLLKGEITSYSREKRYVRKDGRIIWANITLTAVTGPDGRRSHIISVIEDVTERKRVEAERMQLAAIVENSNDAIIGRSLDGTITSWNAGAERLLGYSASEAIGRPMTFVLSPGQPVRTAEINEKVIRGEAVPPHETRRRTKDGRVIDVMSSVSSLRDGEGRVVGSSQILHDITERKLQERKIEKLTRIYAVSSDINAAIVRARNKQQLYYEACRIAVEHGKFGMAWIGELDAEKLEVRPVASVGMEESGFLMRTVLSVRPESPHGQGVLPRAVREHRPVFNNDITVEPEVGGERRKEAIRRGYRSVVVLPLTVENTIVGTFSMFAKELNYFDDEELKLLTELAGNISFALEHMARQDKIEKLSRVRAISSEINTAIVRVRERDALLKETCRIASEQGKFDLVWVGTIDHEEQKVLPIAWAGFSAETAHAVSWATISSAKGTLGEAMHTRRAALRDDIEKQLPAGKLRQEALAKGCHSTVCLPLVVDDQVAALVTLFAPGRGFFNEDELALLNEAASNISFALEGIARQEKIERLSRIRAVSSQINAAIVRIRNRQELFDEACRIAVEAGRFPFAWLGIVNREAKQLKAVAWAGDERGFLDSMRRGRPLDAAATQDHGPARRAVLEKKAVVANDIRNDPAVPRKREHLERNINSVAALPLLVADEAVGVLALHAREAGFFDEEEVKMLSELASDIAFALDHIEKAEKLEYLSYYDTVTGLPNRSLFMDRAGQQMRSRGGEPLMAAVILVNLERFRNINETFGRQGGDTLLKLVAHRLEAAFHGKDYLARVGADNFGVVMRGIRDAATVVHAVESQILACFHDPFRLRETEVRAAARVGVAMFPADGAEVDTLFGNAEAALKKARVSGERFLFYAADMNARAAQVVSLETRLRKAVEAREFVLHYQPKIDLGRDAICGLEALIRWQEPGAGLVPPGAFIPLLEETGLILEVGKWAIGRALADHREWTACGCTVPRVAVNVSAIQLQRRDFADMVVGAVHEAGDTPEILELEVTESLIMKDIQESIRKLSILHGLGIHIAMDDFGTGYSSLSYIARLPISSVKIDRSFINTIAGSPQDMAIVTTIIALAHSLNLRVVAEGVETKEQSQLLKLLKCDEAQGYLFSKPLPAKEIESQLRAKAQPAR
jgi:PAS domain S-box-containing protein/diguanylate cyclase (GGDEF)-like protein